MRNGSVLEDWMKGCPALPGGPLESKPTGLNTYGFNPAGFFCCALGVIAAHAAVARGLAGGFIMRVLKSVLWSSVGMAALGVLGCDVFLGGRAREDRVYVEPQPQYVPQPVYVEQQPQYVIVQQAPPPIRVERRPSPPSAAHIWIDGYWNWDNQRYSWVGGRYELPPQPGVIWVAARYDSDAKGYRYTPGRWAKQNQGNDRGRGRGN